jgi:GcrA cell cycle regulator
MLDSIPRTKGPRALHAEIISGLASGEKQSDIAFRLGVTRGWVSTIGIRHGYRRAVRVSTRGALFVRAARVLWGKGLSASAIGFRLGVTKNVVIGVAHRNGFSERGSPIRRVG